MSDETRTIEVNYLARVEGEGSLHLRIDGDRVMEAQLKIYEPPRLFEALLRGRDFREAPDITQRICGICPVAYLMSACHAMEAICGVTVDGPLRALRRLLYCGEWLESHALHVFMLHTPDFLGVDSAVELAQKHPEVVEQGLRLKKLGNTILARLGGREIHPINVRVGGFYKVPRPQALQDIREEALWALDTLPTVVDVVKGFDFPDFEREYEFVALRHPQEYPFNEGRLLSNRGIDCPIDGYETALEEYQVRHSTSLQSRAVGRDGGRDAVHMGPLARYALNRDLLLPRSRELAERAGLGAMCRNPFRSILVRLVEMAYACEEAVRIIDSYEMPDAPAVPVEPRAGEGFGATEAPRGTCYHRYRIDDAGLILEANIVAPTSVNQLVIERDLAHFASAHTQLPDAELQSLCERVIRNYDPCISCSCHFLSLTVDRS